MSITCGFFNSFNYDRRYDAVQMSRMFDGLIVDGVFASIGTCFVAEADTGLNVNVGIGKAWFNSTWTFNDAILPIEAPISEVLLDRIDAVVIEVDTSEAVRNNDIKFVQGVPSSSPIRPTLASGATLNQYPICYIHRPAGSTDIIQSQITNMIGSEATPFVTGILQTISLDELLGQWEDELDRFVASEQADFTNWMTGEQADFTNWMTGEQADFTNWMTGEKSEYNDWFNQMKTDLLEEQALLDQFVASEQADFLAWFNQMKDQLSTDAAGNLQLEIDKEEIERILLVGFVDGSKVFSDDGTMITSMASDGRTLVKTFTNGFSTMTNVLKSSVGAEIARLVKTFDSNGKLIETVVTYF